MCDNRIPDLVANLNEYPYHEQAIDQNELGKIFIRGLYGVNRINNSSCCFRYVIIEDSGDYRFCFPIENSPI